MLVDTHLPLGKVNPGIRERERLLAVDRGPADAEVVEVLGYDGLVLTETKEVLFVVMALAAATTSRIPLTTAVAIAFFHSPTVTALTAWTLQRGRFVLGLGPEGEGHLEHRYGLAWSAPGPGIDEHVRAVRAVWDTWQRPNSHRVRPGDGGASCLQRTRPHQLLQPSRRGVTGRHGR